MFSTLSEQSFCLINRMKSQITLSKQDLVFTCLQYKSFENTVGKEVLVKSNFSFSYSFLPFQRTLHHFHQIQSCRLQTLAVWKRLKFVIWERDKFDICSMQGNYFPGELGSPSLKVLMRYSNLEPLI